MGDFNANVSESTLTFFCTLFKLKNLVKESTKPENPGFIDLFSVNCAFPRSFFSVQ